jgi:hypothetical protein
MHTANAMPAFGHPLARCHSWQALLAVVCVCLLAVADATAALLCRFLWQGFVGFKLL